MSRKCPVCGDPIAGRADKKYCSDQCRSLQNNKKKYKSQRPILETNRIIRKNRSILKQLCPVGKATVRREVLSSMGYDFTFFTSAFTTAKGLYYICYDYAFCPVLDNDVEKVLIVTNQKFMKPKDPWRYLHKNMDIDDLKYFL